MKFIALAGLAGVGKTTAATVIFNRLTVKWGIPCIRASYALPIKTALEMIQVNKTDYPLIYRDLAQYVGQYMRDREPNWWVDVLDKKLFGRPDIDSYQAIIIDDMRYNNELGYVQDRGGHAIYVQAGDRIDTTLPTYTHESEFLALNYHEGRLDAAADFDVVLNGGGSLEDYQNSVIQLADQIGYEMTEQESQDARTR